MRTILCPTDLSKNSENATWYAIDLAQKSSARILLMHAYETPVIYTDVAVTNGSMDFEVYRETALKALQKFFTKFKDAPSNVRFELILQQGLPSARTIEVAIEKKADLIVTASTSTNKAERLLIGSNTGRILRDAPCKVLMIPSKIKYSSIRKIVYATDLTDENLRASLEVVAFAKQTDAELIFLNIDNKSLVHDSSDLIRVTDRIKQYVTYAKMQGYVCTDLNIADGITYFLKNHKADCLAMATHHRKFLAAVFNPSVTKRVSFKADIPLLVVNTPEH